jgi:hypothetical protein
LRCSFCDVAKNSVAEFSLEMVVLLLITKLGQQMTCVFNGCPCLILSSDRPLVKDLFFVSDVFHSADMV